MPTAISGTFLMLEIMVMHSSGIELPIEITLKPITIGDILVDFARLLAPKINLLAANNKRAKLNTKLVTEPKMLITPDI